jgi:hypothetical protein
MLLAEKYGLELPPKLRQDLDSDEATDGPDDRNDLSGLSAH